MKQLLKIFLAVALIFTASLTYAQTSSQQLTQPERLLIHVAEATKWAEALSNAKNAQKALGGGNVAIEIVANSRGLEGLMLQQPAIPENVKAELNIRIAAAIKSGIRIVACENTMTGRGLTEFDMLPNIEYTPAVVVEILQKQRQGWAYMRP